MAPVFAALAALSFAGAAVVARKGGRHVSTLGGFLVSLPPALAVSVAVALLDPPDAPPPAAALGLLVLGGLATGVGRMLAIHGLRTIDASVFIPIQSSIYPAVGVVGGLLVFGERLDVARALGVAAIVAGVALLSRQYARRRVGVGVPLTPAGAPPPTRLALLLPLGAGVAYGATDVATKEAMLAVPHPAFGAAVSILACFLVWLGVLAASGRARRLTTFGPGTGWFVLHGVFSATGIMAALAALERGAVSVVTPIIATQPLAIVVLSALLLRDVEIVTARAALGSLLVVAGAVVLGAT